MENKAKRFLRLLLAIAMVMAIVPMTFALATEINGTEAISENMVWNDGDVVNGVTISGNVTITVKGTVTVNGTIRLSPDAISNVVFEGEDNAKLIRGSAFTGQMFYAEGVSGNFQNLTFNNITLDGGAVWSGEVDKTLNRGKTNEGVKATGSVLYLVYANADLNNSALQNHDDSTGEKANAVFLRYYSTIDFNNSVVRNNNSISSYYRGGVITVRQGGTVKTNGAEVYGNSGVKGGFYGTSSTGSYGGVVEVYNSKFHNNYASNGAVFDMQCNSKIGYLLIDGCEFYENSSKQGLIYEYSYSRPVIIKDSYFHDNECAVWDCPADPFLDVSGKIVVEEDSNYNTYLFDIPLVLSGPLAEGSSIPMSEATVAQLMKSGYLITGTAGYGVSVNDLAKLSLPESYQCVLVDKNSDGFGDLVAYKPSLLVENKEITLTLKDSMDASASKTGNVYSAIDCLPVNPFAHAGYTFAGWVDAEGNIVVMQKFTEKATLTATWNLEAPIVKLSRDGAILKGTVTNKYEGLTYTYQWYKNDVAIEGATAATYTMTDVNSASYKCIVTVSDGENVVTGSVSGKSSAPAAAQVGETKYATLKEAIDAANDQGTATVTLLKDVEFAGISQGNKVVGLTISGNVTISGAHTITRANTYTGTLFTVNSGATLTLDGGLIIDGNNDYDFDAELYKLDLEAMVSVPDADAAKWFTPEDGKPVASAFMITTKGGTINLNAVTIQNNYSVNHGIIFAEANSTITLTGAKITHVAATKNSGVVANVTGANINVIVNEGTVIEGNHVGGNHGIFKIYSGAKLTMNGGEIKNTTGWNSNGNVVGLFGGTFIMNGGTICSNSSVYGPSNGRNAAIYLHSNSVMEMHGGVICHNSGRSRGGIDSSKSTSKLTITGGSVMDNISLAGNTTADIGGTVGTWEITGGTFTQDVSQWCAEGFTCKPLVDGTWTVVDHILAIVDGVAYKDWGLAKAAIKGNSKIVLQDDIVNEGSFSVGAMYKTVTLDLNGHTFTTTTIGQGNHATLKIVDSAENGSVVVTNYTALYTNGYLDIASDVNFNSYIQINRHSDDQQPSTGCLLIDGVKWIGRGHFKQDDGIIVTTGGYVTIKNNFKDITFNSGNFFLNNTADFAKFAGEQNITVNAGATLDLNGNELTTDSIVCFSELIDTNVEKIGGVTVTTDNISWVQKDYMPIYDSIEGYYSLFTYKLNSLGPALNKDGTAAKFGVALCFDKLEAYDLIKNGDGVHSVNLTFVLTIQNKNIYCAYTPEMIAAWAAGAKSHYSQTPAPTTHYALILTVLNLDTMDEGDSLTVTPTVGSYVQTQGAEAPTPIFSAKSGDLTVVKLNNVVTEPTTPAVPANEDEDSGDDGSSEGTSGGDGDPDSQDQ